MTTAALFSLITAFIALLCAFISLVMVAILGRTRMKKVDEYYYGFIVDNDSIFFQIVRFPLYVNIFSSRWYARRAGQLDMYEHFDKKFKRPFLIAFMLVIFSFIFAFISWVIQEYYT